jgi:guanosine-3',5'-bis(diphosphate) 3'-pyrophosphohydrolase
MNLKEIDKFFGYKPFFDKDPVILVEKIKDIAKEYLDDKSLEQINKAYIFANQAHGDIIRLSGEPYIIHPLKSTLFLMEIKPDIASIQACILHDVIEDTPITYQDIEKEFSTEVADLCEGLVKVSKIKYKWEDRQIETIKKTFLAMAKDLRVLFIKLADRVHNIQTLHFHPKKEKQEKIALETMKIYVPIAKKLGLYHFQLYLENGCFKILYPEDFQKIVQYMRKNFSSEYAYVEKGIKKLNKFLKEEWLKDITIKWRLKSPYRIREKIHQKYNTTDFSKVMDMLAFRIVTKDIGDVYLTLWIIHKHYTPMINRIKDYIAIPKFNGYRSIHTTILWMFRFPVEIQIRTKEMDDIAEYWVAAHYGYSENKWSITIPKNQAEWIKKLQDLVNTYQINDNKEWFKNELNIEMLNKSTFLYTPKWDIIELTRWASVLDFAFHIHTEVWLKFKNALVNREIKPIWYIPKNGDVIMIQTWKNKYTANKHRVDYLKTPSAKWHLNRYLKTQNREIAIKETIEELNKKLKEMWLSPLRSKEDKIAKMLSPEELEKKILAIMEKKLTYGKIINIAYPELKDINKKTNIQKINNIKNEVIIDGNSILNYQLCPECRPKIWDKIVAKVWRHEIKIHTLGCKALKTVVYNHLLESHRKWQEINIYQFNIVLGFPKKYTNIMQIMQRLSELNIDLHHVWVKNQDDGTTEMTIESHYKSPGQIDYFIKDLKNYYNFIEVKSKQLK